MVSGTLNRTSSVVLIRPVDLLTLQTQDSSQRVETTLTVLPTKGTPTGGVRSEIMDTTETQIITPATSDTAAIQDISDIKVVIPITIKGSMTVIRRKAALEDCLSRYLFPYLFRSEVVVLVASEASVEMEATVTTIDY